MAITYVSGDSASNSTGVEILCATTSSAAADFGILYSRGDSFGITQVLNLSTGTGWTQLFHRVVTGVGRDSVEAVWYKKFGASEPSPGVTPTTVEQFSASLSIFRGVNATTPFDATYVTADGVAGTNSMYTANPAITTGTTDAAVVLLAGYTGDDMDTAGAPSGYTLGQSVIAATRDERQQAVAYLLAAGAAGTKTPGVWTHTAAFPDLPDYRLTTLALALPGGGGSTVPAAVSDLAGTAGSTQVALTWTAPSDGGSAITDYVVQYRPVP